MVGLPASVITVTSCLLKALSMGFCATVISSAAMMTRKMSMMFTTDRMGSSLSDSCNSLRLIGKPPRCALLCELAWGGPARRSCCLPLLQGHQLFGQPAAAHVGHPVGDAGGNQRQD